MNMNTKAIALGLVLLIPFASAAMAATTESTPATPHTAPTTPPASPTPGTPPQSGAPVPHAMHHAGGYGPEWIQKTTDMLKTNLALSDDQTKRVHGALEAAHKEAMKEREKTREDLSGLFKTAEERHRVTDEKIAAVLTPEQRTKYEANKDQWRRTEVHDEIVGHLKSDLALTKPQVAQVSDIITASQNEIAEARKANAGDEKKLLEAVRAIHKGTETTIEGVLTPDQKTKYAEMREEHRESRHAFLHGGEPAKPKS